MDMKAAIIGTGFAADMHARSLAKQGVEIVAVTALSHQEAKAFAQKWRIPRWGTEAELIWESDADCVHICTPPASHYELIKACLAHGKHVLCEKPLCLSDEEAAACANLARNSGLVCAVSFNVRAYLACQKAKELVSQPDFGRILLVHGSYQQEYGASPAMAGWRRGEPMYAITEIGSHWLDLAQYISGQSITQISAQRDHFHQTRYQKDNLIHNQPVENGVPISVPAEDIALLSLRFEGGAMGQVVLSETSHGRVNRLTIEVVGEHKSLWWMSEEPGMLHVGTGKFQPVETLTFEDDFAQTFRRIAADTYAAIGGRNGGVAASVEQAQRNVRLCNAACQSSEHNAQWVEMPV